MENLLVGKEYITLVEGVIEEDGYVDMPIGRDRHNSKKQICIETGKSAYTEYKIIEKKKNKTLLKVNITTGRTHQIRVHMSSIDAPLVGDTLYNTKPSATLLPRQSLHAYRISFPHPITGERMKFTAPIPSDMKDFIASLNI